MTAVSKVKRMTLKVETHWHIASPGKDASTEGVKVAFCQTKLPLFEVNVFIFLASVNNCTNMQLSNQHVYIQ